MKNESSFKRGVLLFVFTSIGLIAFIGGLWIIGYYLSKLFL